MTAPAAVVVNHDAGAALLECVASLRAEGVEEVVVVDNASSDGSPERLEAVDGAVTVIRTGSNLGYGAGVNRGISELHGELVLVSNPDVVVHRGAVEALAEVLHGDEALAIAGPRIVDPGGARYPSARRFPSWLDAAGHALLGAVAPANPFTGRYRMADLDASGPSPVDWVSGACFMTRLSVLEELGGFDERYFMYLEDVDLCWRAHRRGYGVAYVPDAVVTHVQGLSTARRPYRMLVAHHRSALLFAARRTRGWHRLGLPFVVLLLGLRLALAVLRQVFSASAGRPRSAD